MVTPFPWPGGFMAPSGGLMGTKDWPGGAFESIDLPDPPDRDFSFGRSAGADRHGTTTWTWLHSPRRTNPLPDSGVAEGSGVPRQVLAGRKPLLVLRFAGAFLLRFAERTFAG